LPVRSTDDIIRKAHQWDAARRVSVPSDGVQLKSISKRLDVLEAKIDVVMRKLSLEQPVEKTVHTRLLEALADWKSTQQLAAELSYRQEYVSRCVATLKRNGSLETRKQGKTIFYRKTA
ncbi:MAG: hypothetical protein HY366_03435, partial [Candidatus Aenigmarchaeota archaeon]|nr:hypothetical protein [Candidatus Aenigmarchaeota archaeon]